MQFFIIGVASLISVTSATHGFLRNYAPPAMHQSVQTFNFIPETWRRVDLCQGLCEKFASDNGWLIEQKCEEFCDYFIFWKPEDGSDPADRKNTNDDNGPDYPATTTYMPDTTTSIEMGQSA